MKDSKNIVIGMLCAVVCVMAVAYAAFSTSLTVTTTAIIDSNWCIQVVDAETSCTTSGVKGGAEVTADVTGTGLDRTVEMHFQQPGDTATCTITYKNCGTLNAALTHEVDTDPLKVNNLEEGVEIKDDGSATVTDNKITLTVSSVKGSDLNAGSSKVITVTGVFLETVESDASDSEVSLIVTTKAAQK